MQARIDALTTKLTVAESKIDELEAIIEEVASTRITAPCGGVVRLLLRLALLLALPADGKT